MAFRRHDTQAHSSRSPTLCSVMAFWKPLYAVLASKDASEALDSSKAITSWPRAAAASEK